jgi:hypothetical protein
MMLRGKAAGLRSTLAMPQKAEEKREETMSAGGLKWPRWVAALGLTLVLMGCAMDDQAMKRLNAAEERHMGVELNLQSTKDWNSTDWSLWMTLQGGG